MMISTSYPTNNMNNANAIDAPSYPFQSQSQQQSQQQSQALVPAIAPGKTIYNNNYYVLPSNTSDDLIDFGVDDGPSTGYGSTYSSQQSTPTTNDDLISFDNNNTSFATPPQPTTAAPTRNMDAVKIKKSLQDRDDEFVKSLPIELIEEQERILAQIQRSNTSRSHVVSYSPTNNGQQQYQQKFDASLPDASIQQSQLPQEVHPKKYKMKDARKVKTAASATTGAVVGGLMFGPAWPVGVVAGAAVGGYAGKVISRSGERKQQRKWDKKNFNEFTKQGKADVQSENVTFA